MNGAAILLGYFTLLFILVYRYRTVALLPIAIQLVSLGGTFLIGGSEVIDSLREWVAVLTIAAILSCAILPWARGYRVQRVLPGDEVKLRRVTNFLIGISLLPFFTLLITAIFVITRVEDINDFKYTDGVSTEFYYQLPINVRLIILSNFLHNFGYFLIPLHLYYLSVRKFMLSAVCFVLSLNVVLYGLTFFSRWAVTHYLLIYFSFLLLMGAMLEKRVKTIIKQVAAVLTLSFIAYFVALTNQRFKYDSAYHELVRRDAIVQSPVVYSYLSYLSQSYEYGVDRLTSYNYQTFGGQISLFPVLSLLGQYRIINYSTDNYNELRRSLWYDQADKFTGLSSYLIYDFGYLGTALVCAAYFIFLIKIRPKNGVTTVANLFHYALLIQIPLFAIFYSFIAGILIPYLMLLPILLYLRFGPSSFAGGPELARPAPGPSPGWRRGMRRPRPVGPAPVPRLGPPER